MAKSAVTKNYVVKGGAEWVVGGKLTILEGAEITDLDGAITKAEEVAELESNAILDDVITAFNGLVSALKTAGLMESTPEPDPDPNPEEDPEEP